jgi:FO synthase
MHVQVPPNLSYDEFPRLLEAGIDDWGGVSPVTLDHVNPEAPWPEIERLRQATETAGFALAPRLPIYPEYVADLDRWADPRVAQEVRKHAEADGLAREDRWAAGVESRPPRLPRAEPLAVGRVLDEDAVTALFQARGPELGGMLAAADELRREMSGDEITYVVTRNINYTNVCYFRCGFCAFSKGSWPRTCAARRTSSRSTSRPPLPRGLGARRRRGLPPGRDPPRVHRGLLRRARRGDQARAARPACACVLRARGLAGRATLGLPLADYLARLRDAGLASLPGTAAEILDDEVGESSAPTRSRPRSGSRCTRPRTKAGLRSTATIMFGSVEGPRSWARHLIAVRELQKRTGGFTELVPLPFVHMEAPIYLKGGARPGRPFREAVLMHAVARLALHPHIPNIQTSWVKMGIEGAQACLEAGATTSAGRS